MRKRSASVDQAGTSAIHKHYQHFGDLRTHSFDPVGDATYKPRTDSDADGRW